MRSTRRITLPECWRNAAEGQRKRGNEEKAARFERHARAARLEREPESQPTAPLGSPTTVIEDGFIVDSETGEVHGRADDEAVGVDK